MKTKSEIGKKEIFRLFFYNRCVADEVGFETLVKKSDKSDILSKIMKKNVEKFNYTSHLKILSEGSSYNVEHYELGKLQNPHTKDFVIQNIQEFFQELRDSHFYDEIDYETGVIEEKELVSMGKEDFSSDTTKEISIEKIEYDRMFDKNYLTIYDLPTLNKESYDKAFEEVKVKLDKALDDNNTELIDIYSWQFRVLKEGL